MTCRGHEIIVRIQKITIHKIVIRNRTVYHQWYGLTHKGLQQSIMNMNEKEDKYLTLQKKLLALNASFEAARAGEVGTDFFMVVDKLSDLAMQWGKTTGHNDKLGDG